MTMLQDALEEINKKLGHSPNEIIPDGKIHRFGDKKSCWYACHEWEYKGNTYQKILYGDFRSGQELMWQSYDKKVACDKNFHKAYVNKTRENQVALDLERQEMNKLCKEKWGPIFAKANRDVLHDYLTYKGVALPYISRVDSRNTMLIPMYDHESFVGVQMIFQNNNEYIKRFSTGVKKQGAICPLIPFKKAEFIFLAEGFATAASIQQAFPDTPCIVGFDAGNLIHAINTIRFINPKCKIVIAADRDTNNKGEWEAKRCCQNYANVIYKMPTFPESSPREWTDFNDLHNYVDIIQVQKQLAFLPEDFISIQALGHDEESGHYYYTSSTNSQIIPIPASGHSQASLKRIVASEDFWLKHYGVKNDEGKARIDWGIAQSDLMQKCHDAKEFKVDRIRGTGVWYDKLGPVFNDGVNVHNKPDDTQFLYRKGNRVQIDLIEDDRLDLADVQHGLKGMAYAFKSLRYKNPNDALILPAWVIQSQIFGALPWRFHVWLTGDRGTGKSTIMNKISKMAPISLLTDDATEAGIIQTIRSDATAIVYDEFEKSYKSRANENVNNVLNFARRMSSSTGAKKLRGTSGGKAIVHNHMAVFLFGSIRSETLDSADASRFFKINLDQTVGQTVEEWAAIEGWFNHVIKYKQHIFSACFHHLDNILASWEAVRSYLRANHKLESRYSDQIATLLACYHVCFSFNIITKDEIQAYLDEYKLIDEESEYMEQNAPDDGEQAYQDLMKTLLDHEAMTVEKAIKTLKNLSSEMGDKGEYLRSLLWAYGMSYVSKHNALFVSNPVHLKNLERKIGHLSFYNVLRRNERYCVKPKSVQEIDKKPIRGILLKIF